MFTSRPTTISGRPQTSNRPQTSRRPVTAVSTRAGGVGDYVVALIETRGIAHEVGIAALNKDTGHVVLVQIADSPTYAKTLHHLSLHPPSLILLPDTILQDDPPPVLVQCLEEDYPNCPIEPVLRKYWNDIAGLDFISQLSIEGEDRTGVLFAAAKKYYALSAASALFKHAEHRQNTRFSAGALRISYRQMEGTMMIDTETARNLELVRNSTFAKSNHSLFGALNHTWTPMGRRMLRMNLLSPVTSPEAIDLRLDAVEELVQAEDKFTAVRTSLKSVNKVDFDVLIASLVSSKTKPVSSSAKVASTRVTQMLSLRTVARCVPRVYAALVGCRSRLLATIAQTVNDPRIAEIDEIVSSNLNDDAMPSKGSGLAAINTRVYAVKANRNRLLDVARETYKENVGDIFALNTSLSEKHDLPLSLSCTQEAGFSFTLRKDDLEEYGGQLPREFVDPVVKNGKWHFSSVELKKRNARMRDALDEAFILGEKIIHDLTSEVIVHIGALYKASEAVALLDMLWSFAHTSTLRSYIRPEFTGTLAIKDGRHPILETVQSTQTVVPNDVYCCEASSFQLVQGPNMSGKSTYLRQIGLLTVMAMCGCFVPAVYASFRIHDALLTRLSNDDDLEHNMSTFASEMASTAMILNLASDRSLILVDELGRGTSTREGIGLSHAIAEALIRLKSFVFFATCVSFTSFIDVKTTLCRANSHFRELSVTLSRNPTVTNLHLAVQKSRRSASNFGLTFEYRILDGPPDDNDHYGLTLAELADLPEDVLKEATRIAHALSARHARAKAASENNKLTIRRKAILRLRTQLRQTLAHSALEGEDLQQHLIRLQQDMMRVLTETA